MAQKRDLEELLQQWYCSNGFQQAPLSPPQQHMRTSKPPSTSTLVGGATNGDGGWRPLALGQDVLNVIAGYCHPIDLARLALCNQELLPAVEESAALLCSFLTLTPSSSAPSAAPAAPPAITSAAQQQQPSNSWRYRYLCAFEVACVGPARLKTALRSIYEDTPSATQLNLYGLQMGDAGAERLALALCVARAHQVLLVNLGGNNLSDKGAQAVVQALQRHHNEVATLSLAQNRIGASGARSVAGLISSSGHKLRSLSLSDNPITDEGAQLITASLPESTSLATLSMRCATFSTQAREGIRSCWGGRGGNTVFGLYI